MHQLRSTGSDTLDDDFTNGLQTPFSSQIIYGKHQNNPNRAFCHEQEGWGPLSYEKDHLTPCFIEACTATAAITLGVLLGGTMIYRLRQIPPSEKPSWSLYAKIIASGIFACTSLLQAYLQAMALPRVWLWDIQFWAPIGIFLSTCTIASVQLLEHTKAQRFFPIAALYWPTILVGFSAKIQSFTSRYVYSTQLPYVVTLSISVISLILATGLEYFTSPKQTESLRLRHEMECPEQFASKFDVLTFTWMTPLMKVGSRQCLDQKDLWKLPKEETTVHTSRLMQESWEKQLFKTKPSLWIAMYQAFGSTYLKAGLIKVLSDVLVFVQPQLLYYFINWIDSFDDYPTRNRAIRQGLFLACSMFAVATAQSILIHQYFVRVFKTGMRIRGSLTALVYRKALRISNPTGDIVNHMAVDAHRLEDFTQWGHQLWSAPLQILLCMASLHRLLGHSVFVGMGIMVVSAIMNGFLAKKMERLQKVQMVNKDTRMRLMSDVLTNMKTIKVYAWERFFMQKVDTVRVDAELRTLKSIELLYTCQVFLWALTHITVATATFAVFVFTTNIPLSPSLVFPCLTLFGLLRFPLEMLPKTTVAAIEASTATGRLIKFFLSDELQSDPLVIKPYNKRRTCSRAVSIENASFLWDFHSDTRCLKDLNFIARKGELSCVIGRVGCGKSAFLKSILGELWRIHGDVSVFGRVAYVAQQPWVRNGTIRDNIVFGNSWDASYYEQTTRACSLLPDLDSLPHGDLTKVGESGNSLSGGQRARIALARAIYARADVYLLDDVLSAVDQHVSNHILKHVLGPTGILASKTRILSTSTFPVLREADHVVLLQDGHLIEEGTYDQFISRRGDGAQLIRSTLNSTKDGQTSPNGTSYGSFAQKRRASKSHGIQHFQKNANTLDSVPFKSLNGTSNGEDLRKGQLENTSESTAIPTSPDLENADYETQNEEHRGRGKVDWRVYKAYAKASNVLAVCLYCVALISSQSFFIVSNIWLKRWSEMNQRHKVNTNVHAGIGYYFVLGAVGVALVVLGNLLLCVLCSLRASRILHQKMMYAIFRSPIRFFETNPAGRILNRFSHDLYYIDEIVAKTFDTLFEHAARAIFTLALITASTPIFASLIVPLAYLYFYYQQFFLQTARELKRLNNISHSPIFAHFQESIRGSTTIRAFQSQARFIKENSLNVDANIQTTLLSISANRWLGVRLEFIGSITIFTSAVFAVIAVASGKGPSAGMVGLAMSYALQITQILMWVVRQTAEVERNIVSVERCLEYTELPTEEQQKQRHPDASWPSKGVIEFESYSARYAGCKNLVLEDLNLRFEAGEKIGVVGRTGAGKSSLALALTRMIENTSGSISIDGLDISTIDLFELRNRVTLIPQETHIFDCSVRENIDPGLQHDDTEIWAALTYVGLREYVSTLPGQLEAKITKKGSSLSQGQGQLISLARALLSPAKIIILDEPTAAIDSETEAHVQAVLRSSLFHDRTIITVAHRINTVLGLDRVAVMDHGAVMEFDTPENLIGRRGRFFELVREAGLMVG